MLQTCESDLAFFLTVERMSIYRIFPHSISEFLTRGVNFLVIVWCWVKPSCLCNVCARTIWRHTFLWCLPLHRKATPRVTSAPINRPTTVVTSLSVDDVVMAGSCRRPLRLRPNTLALCSTSYSPSTSAATPTCSTLLDNSPRCHFASSCRLLYPSNSASISTLSPASTQPPRPASTVSAALSAEAFESPLPTAVLPHLLVGCQADAMSAKVCTEFGVTHVINVSADGETSPHVPPSRFLRIPIHDNGKADMVPYFERAFAFLGELITHAQNTRTPSCRL